MTNTLAELRAYKLNNRVNKLKAEKRKRTMQIIKRCTVGILIAFTIMACAIGYTYRDTAEVKYTAGIASIM